MVPARRAANEHVETMMEQEREASGVEAGTRSGDSDIAELDRLHAEQAKRE